MRQVRWPELPIVGWGLGLNVLWEFAQTPLYRDADREWQYLLWSRFHCAVGDVLILLGAYWATALVFRDRQWPWHRPSAGILFVTIGIGYTVFSEWLNTSLRSSWQYADEMPLVLGIGLTPILQWIILPVALLLLIRQRESRLLR